MGRCVCVCMKHWHGSRNTAIKWFVFFSILLVSVFPSISQMLLLNSASHILLVLKYRARDTQGPTTTIQKSLMKNEKQFFLYFLFKCVLEGHV